RRGADDRATPARAAARAPAGALARRAARAPARDLRRLRRPAADLLRGLARDGDAGAGRARPRGARRLRVVRGQPARPDQPRPGRPRARARPRPRLRARRGHARAREGRAPPPARPQLPGARGGGRPRRDPRRRARAGARAADRPRKGGGRVIAGRQPAAAPVPERPGPGPMPQALLRALDVHVSRRVAGILSGDFRSALHGAGTELAQVRLYAPGDDVRRIDWNVTARTGQPHVRVHLAERVLVSWLVLDTSLSMGFGTADRRKADVAEGVAIALGHLATRHGNKLGIVTFGDSRPRSLPPRQGKVGLIGVLEALRREPDVGQVGATSFGEAL